MARFEFKLPDIGEGVTEGEIVAWAEGIAPGAHVEPEQGLAEVMTDKATVTIPSPKAGTIVELGGKVGDVIPVGHTLVVIETDGAGQGEPAPQPKAAEPAPVAKPEPVQAPPATPQFVQPKEEPSTAAAVARVETAQEGPEAPAKREPSATAAGDIPERLPGMDRPQAAGDRAAQPTVTPLAAPSTRRLARELGIELSQVPGSGPGGRITEDDVRRYAEQKTQPAAAPAPAPVRPAAAAAAPVHIAPPVSALDQAEERVPLRGVRKKIFEQMARSKQTAAHFTFVEECDATALKALRQRMQPLAEKAGARLNYLPFIVKAVVAALKRHPALNSAFDETTQEIVYRKVYNIGIAVATDAGLMVPVIKHADRLSLLDIAKEIVRLSDAARAGRIAREDLVGSTFTVTSLGAQGGLLTTPVLNFPEVGILGVHQIKEKPVVRDGQIVIGHVMMLGLSFDHRLIDGHVGAAFAYEVIRLLEDPDRLMLEMS